MAAAAMFRNLLSTLLKMILIIQNEKKTNLILTGLINF